MESYDSYTMEILNIKKQAILKYDTTDFKKGNITRGKEKHFLRIKESIHHREIMILTCMHIFRASKYKQKCQN